MSSLTLSLSGKTSELKANYYPPIELDKAYEWEAGLVDLHTFMTIPNVTLKNNVFIHKFLQYAVIDVENAVSIDAAMLNYMERTNQVCEQYNENYRIENIQISPDLENAGEGLLKVAATYIHYTYLDVGSYEFEELITHIQNKLKESHLDTHARVDISVDKRTLKCHLESNRTIVFDSSKNTIGSLLGFKNGTLNVNIKHRSEGMANIMPTNVIRLETNITGGSYANDKRNRGLHEFYPSVGIGYKVVEKPKTVIYLPVSERCISQFIVRLVDQNGDLVDFRGETITLRIHIRRAA